MKESDRDWWDLPGGGMDHGESVEQALARELNEEVLLQGSFSHQPILIENPKCLSDHNFYQTRIVCAVSPENLSFAAGEDGDEILFVDPATFESSNKTIERKIFEYAKLASSR